LLGGFATETQTSSPGDYYGNGSHGGNISG
jgi:hypothetical protein